MHSGQGLHDANAALGTSISIAADMDIGVSAMNRGIDISPGCCSPLNQSGNSFTFLASMGVEIEGGGDLVSIIFVNKDVGN